MRVKTAEHYEITGAEASRIAQITTKDLHIEIRWQDGHESKFHFVWLRHNCPCEICRHAGTDQNMNLIENIQIDDQPATLEFNDDSVIIEWATDRHRTKFEAKWLRSNCYSDLSREARDHKPILLTSSSLAVIPTIECKAYLETDQSLLQVMQAINKYGMVFVSSVPTEDEAIINLAQRFGPIRETNYGAVNDMKVHKDKVVISYTDAALTAHCDEPYCYEPLGIAFFHCLQSATEEGGISIFVDCFKVAEDLRREDPNSFELLTTVPIQYMRDHADEQEYRAEGALISLDFFGNINGVRYAERPLAPFDIPDDLVIPMYRAFAEFTRRVRMPENEIRFGMKAGQALIFDNQRMTHGRTRFSGERHLRTAYVERDFFHSKLRVLSRRSGEPLLGRLPAGAR